MKKINLLLIIFFVSGILCEILPQANFSTSLHATRKGKIHWYNKVENGGVGGFEVLTNVPITQLGCVECHDAVDANGNQYPPTYTPSCVDCHATNSTWAVTQNDCLGCHSREKTIINMQLPDVHRTAGFTCLSCHKKAELHGDDGVAYNSMMEPGAIQADCSNSGCHAGFTHPNPGVDPHGGKLHCTSCHAQTNLACYSCH
ncbi:MAG: cytochrome c3 family protein, partial [Ignavibacterium sp.]